MRRTGDQVHSNASPHLDGPLEGVMKDAKGKQFGIAQKDSTGPPLQISKLNNDEMEDFEQLMRGKTLDKMRGNLKKR